ncbi:hypothetical protein C2G38_895909 [Gigaspora rosea]|uniref:DUF202 domain-containing protein n=1 Tax=Gigaspora rosea TaxID=44941 RepID=A0A397VKY3_9GLOM|nr:hypothetical protein C2G38_895909 [Gigaspora rosea]
MIFIFIYLLMFFNKINYFVILIAIERTFLSWLRMGVALVLTGLSFHSRFHLTPHSTTMPKYVDALGFLLVFAGLFLLVWAVVNYSRFQIMLKRNVTVIEHGNFHYFIMTFIILLIFMTLFTSIMYTTGAN